MSFDLKIFYFFNNLAGKSAVFDAIVIFSADYLQYALAAIFILFLYLENRPNSQKFKIFLITAISMLIARFGVTNLIRFLYPRSRPFIDYQVNQLIPESVNGFPSGHAALFFALAAAIYFYPNREPAASNGASNKKWGLLFFVAAILMGLSRVVAGVHYPSDILAGAVVGILSAYAVFYLFKRYENLREGETQFKKREH